MKLNSQTSALLKHLATGGDKIAEALVNGVVDCILTAAAENTGANTIKVTGQMKDGVGNPVGGVQDVLVQSVPIAGAGTMTDGGAGVILAGSASKLVWLTTDTTGKFELTVLNATAEKNLIQATTNNGDVAQLVLTFA